jgi:parallel beta-helix repeat protein
LKRKIVKINTQSSKTNKNKPLNLKQTCNSSALKFMKNICLLPLVMTILTVNVAFSSTGTSGEAINILENPGFESGSTIWVVSGDTIQNAGSQLAHGGSWLAELNGFGYVNTETLSQTVIIPETINSASLSFWLHIETAETTTNKVYDTLSVQVQDSSGTVLNTIATYSNLDKDTGYVQKSFDLSPYKGQTIRISFKGTEDYSRKTSFVLDDFLLGTDSTPTPVTSSCASAPTSPLVVNVRDEGAMGNGSTNDTAAIQAAVNQVAGTGGTVLVPDGTYMIDAVTHLKLKSNMTLRMTSRAVLKAIPNNQGGYAIILIERASNLNVIGGTVQGERAQHTGTTGESGMGISIYSSSNVVIEGVTATDNWGDGFYIGRWDARYATNTNLKYCSVIADNNRRQGLSITAVDGAVIKNSIFKNTGGTAPQVGIDLEPDSGDTVKNVRILNSVFTGNRGPGIKLYNGGGDIVTNITIDGNTVSGNTRDWGISALNSTNSTITNNVVQNNWEGITLRSGTSGFVVNNNIVSQNSHANITNGGSGNTITNNDTTAALKPIPSPF